MSSVKSVHSLAAFVRIRQSGVRSVNVEQDLRQTKIAEGYVLTAQARRSMARILESVDSAAPQRAWTLTGPYGSGKSYFGLFLMNLLGVSSPAHLHTLEQLYNGPRNLDSQKGKNKVSKDHA